MFRPVSSQKPKAKQPQGSKSNPHDPAHPRSWRSNLRLVEHPAHSTSLEILGEICLLASLKFNCGTGHQLMPFHPIVVLIAFQFTLSQLVFVEGKDRISDGPPREAGRTVAGKPFVPFEPRREKESSSSERLN